MEAADALASAPKRSAGHRLAGLFHGRPRLQVGTLLAGPLGWLVIGYIGSLVVLLIAAFWSVDSLSGETIQNFTTANFKTLVDDPVYRDVTQRTVLVAAAATLTDAAARLPDRLLHGEGRDAAGQRACWSSRC